MTAERNVQYCDLVMKGGITSGLVYPNAVLALAKKYRFKCIGGTSAGAIAAAVCAAAALGERRKVIEPGLISGDRDAAGFSGLAKVTKLLSSEGFIYQLFQPKKDAEPVYLLLLAVSAQAGAWAIIKAAFQAIMAIAWVSVAATLALLLIFSSWIGGAIGALAALLPSLFCALVVGVIASLFRIAKTIRANQLGICTGLSQSSSGSATRPALTDWLHDVIQDLSGQDRAKPLLFKDLWQAPRYESEPSSERALSLEIITTSISHNEPRSLPFKTGRFWFRREDFDALFPKSLIDCMVAGLPTEVDGVNYYLLPDGGELPVLIAARMSLSFPLLISAVPLYEAIYKKPPAATDAAASEDHPAATDAAVCGEEATYDKPDDVAVLGPEALATGGRGRGQSDTIQSFRVCWFSDGGISSNFPIHLFDRPLPRWPTFGIDLIYPKSDDGGRSEVFLPKNNNQGWQPRYTSIAARAALIEIFNFVFSIIATMQNWRDLIQSRAPGHRDRIVQVPLFPDEGGLNLNMPQPVLDSVVRKGGEAGEKLVEEFKFNNQYWVRWRNVAAGVQQYYKDFAVGAGAPISDSYKDAYLSAKDGSPQPPSYSFNNNESKKEAQLLFEKMKNEGARWSKLDAPDLARRAPEPEARLRIVPTF